MTERRDTIREWWHHRIGARQSPAARGLAARLRRAGPVTALAERAVVGLAEDLRLRDPAALTGLVQVLAEIRTDLPG